MTGGQQHRAFVHACRSACCSTALHVTASLHTRCAVRAALAGCLAGISKLLPLLEGLLFLTGGRAQGVDLSRLHGGGILGHEGEQGDQAGRQVWTLRRS